jgi:hypothetical protein
MSNTSAGYGSVIGGGMSNTSAGYGSVVGGGMSNVSTGTKSFIGAGDNNTISGYYLNNSSVICGGTYNTCDHSYSTIGGGSYNTITNFYACIVGGLSNTSSGYGSVIGGGMNNTANNNFSSICGGGLSNTSSGYGSTVGGGLSNTSSGYGSTVGGGVNNISSGSYSTITGGHGALSSRYGMVANASGYFSEAGDSQIASFILRNTTTNTATPTPLFLDGSSTRLTIPSGKVMSFMVNVSGVNSTGTSGSMFVRQGMIKNVTGTTSLIGSIISVGTDIESNALTNVAITADNANSALQINVTGIATETWRWTARVDAVEIGYGE